MKTFIAIFSLIIILGLSIATAIYSWTELGNVEISKMGMIAMGAGIGLSLIVGIGLMALVYHSARIGRDEEVDELVNKTKEVK